MIATPTLTRTQFERIGRIVREHAGVDLHDGKQELVRSRVARRLRALDLTGFDEYLVHLEAHRREEMVELLDVVTTNKTQFFRESRHFDFLADELGRLEARGRLRFWSAGCSSGEEPYSLAMLLSETLAPAELRAARILATDISRPVLRRAVTGRYTREDLAEVESARIARHLTSTGDGYEIRPELRALVRFARLNLMEAWPMRGPFHTILCRNVMIYFDRETREQLVERFRQLLAPGGCLLIGHSESLSGLHHGYTYVAPATYRR